MIKLYKLLIIGVLFINTANGQDFMPLIQKGWENDQQLKSKTFDLKSAESALLEAKNMYLPTAAFNTQYTLAAGGRSIEFPIGDIINPVYSTLNQLTGSNSFPQLENVSEQFLPNNFYDAKIRVSQPIYYPELALNKQLKEEAIVLKNLEIKAYKRWLSKEIMYAYFQLEKARNARVIYQSADTLLQEARRTTESMVRNGIALPSALNRIESQSAAIEAQQIEAGSNIRNAERYLFFLLGKDITDADTVLHPALPLLTENAPALKEEILQIEKGIDLQHLALDKEKMFYLPRVGAQLDLGSQDFNFGWSPYALLGVNVEINLYDHKKNQYRKDQAKINILSSESKLEHVKTQFDLAADIAYENLGAAIAQANTFQPRISAAKRLYQDVLKKYKEGTANYLELLDAQNQVTQSELMYAVATTNAWEKWAEYVYASAGLEIL